MTNTQSSVIILSYDPSASTQPYSVTHSEFGFYGCFSTYAAAYNYAAEQAAFMRCDLLTEGV